MTTQQQEDPDMLTHADLYAYATGLEAFARRELPFRLSLAAGKRLKKVREILKAVEDERLKLVDKYAKKDENGKNIPDAQGGTEIEDRDAFSAAFKELIDTEVEETLRPLDFSKLEDQMPNVPANEVAALIALGLITDE
jgi:chromatin segregation and condensation protein Rec8/ScpA/Scc1 (kleisin family)